MKRELKSLDSCSVPTLGLGTWKLRGKECEEVVKKALEIGYRHIDTAIFYDNEEAVGRAIKNHRREELFVTTKVWKDKLHYRDFKRSAEGSLKRLDTEYLDLLLIHWPNPEIPLEETIKAMNELVEEGKVRHIGVSNFSKTQLKKAQNLSANPIVNNQVKYHLGMDLTAMLNYCQENGILLTAYSPLGRGKVLQSEELPRIGARYGKTPGQIALKWLIRQANVLAIPKASSEKHLKENLSLFDWEMEERDVERLDQLVIESKID
ncbi:aldo/keto reductase [Candidatus Bipolaricaulota bacterium]|nr:aldo/keto reductase [Candidatus Bipolaricaulota bacterium]